jgi:hypothetical protein
MAQKVQWPDGAYAAGGDDLSEPIQVLLRHLNLLEPVDEDLPRKEVGKGLGNTTPFELQLITAGATSLSKVTAWIVGAFGSLGAATTAVLAFVQNPDNSSPLIIALVGAMALILAVACLALALIVRADVTARATTMAAEYRARADTATALLRGFGAARPAPAPRPVTRYWTRTKQGENYPVTGLHLGGGQLYVEAGERYRCAVDLESLTPFAAWKDGIGT